MQTNIALPLAELKRALETGPRLRLAMLFGSSTSGRLHAGSDVDVAIIPEDSRLPLREELALQAELARIAGRDVGLVRLDRAPRAVRGCQGWDLLVRVWAVRGGAILILLISAAISICRTPLA